MEEDFKILKAVYLSNHSWDLTQILNLSVGNWTKKGKQPIMEEDLKILKNE